MLGGLNQHTIFAKGLLPVLGKRNLVHATDPAWAGGAKGDGVTDDSVAIQAAIDSLPAAGGIVYLPPGTYATSQTIKLGNGTAAVDSTRNGISLLGAGSGTGDGFSSASPGGATVMKWVGAVGGGPMIEIAGPCRNMRVEDIQLHGNDLANVGLSVVHCGHGTFRRVNVRKQRTVAFVLTTRSGVPAGVAHGNGDLIFDNCGNIDPALSTSSGLLLDSGYSTAGSPTFDTTRAVFLAGAYVYGGAAGSYGIKLHGADNNTFVQVCVIRSSLAAVSTDDFLFEQWTGDTTFPKENAFINCVFARSIGGTSGTSGNMFLPLPRDDAGGSIPALPAGCFAITHRGQLVGAAGAGNPWTFSTADGGNAMVALSGAAGTVRGLDWRTLGVQRWQLAANGVAEGGANAGSDWVISRYSDAGAFIDSPVSISRADGGVTFSGRVRGPDGSAAFPAFTFSGDVDTGRYRIGADNMADIVGGSKILEYLRAGGVNKIGVFGVAAVARAAAYTPTNVTTDRSYDADTVVVAELADVVGTLIADLQAYGWLQ